MDPAQIPQTREELPELESFTYDLTVRRAGELNIPVVGSISGGEDRRVVVYEWTRYKKVNDAQGIEYRYGYVIRFCLTVSNLKAQGRISLTFVAAQAELGNLQASWLMQIRGLVGQAIDAKVLPPQEIKVETFVVARQSLQEIIASANDASTRFIPGTLLAKIDPKGFEGRMREAALSTYICHQASRGNSRNVVLNRLAPADNDTVNLVADIYQQLGVNGPDESPNDNVRKNAQRMLNGISATR